MPAENALAFLSQLETGKKLPSVILIAGPQAFLREYVLDACRAALRGPGQETQSFQVGAGAGFGDVLGALSTPGLFARGATVISCRILRSRKAAADDDEGETDDGVAARRSDDSALLRAIQLATPPYYLIILYERDKTPPKIQRQVESSGLVVLCNKPFESQLTQYAEVLARRAGLKINFATTDLLALRYGSNLGAMHNALVLAAITQSEQKPGDFANAGSGNSDLTGELFQLSESLSAPQRTPAFAMLDRALAIGRDPTELLLIEVVPALRRMLLAGLLSAQGEGPAEIAMAMAMSPRSPRVGLTVNAARRYGVQRLMRTYRAAIDLDANLKNGQIKERDGALSQLLAGLLLDETNDPPRRGGVRSRQSD